MRYETGFDGPILPGQHPFEFRRKVGTPDPAASASAKWKRVPDADDECPAEGVNEALDADAADWAREIADAEI